MHCNDSKVLSVDYIPIFCNACVLGNLLSSNWWVITLSAYLCTCVCIVGIKLVLHIVAIRWWDPIPFQLFTDQLSSKLQVVLCMLPVVVHWFTALHAPCVLLWWPVCLHWTWDTLCCPHTCTTFSPVSFSWHSMKEALSLLTCSDIVLHVSSELCLVLTNMYSCHSSTVHNRHLHGTMKPQCRVHTHSVQFVCVRFISGRGWPGWWNLTLSLASFVTAINVYSLEQMFQARSPSLSLPLTLSSYTRPPPPTHVCRPVPLLTVDRAFVLS